MNQCSFCPLEFPTHSRKSAHEKEIHHQSLMAAWAAKLGISESDNFTMGQSRPTQVQPGQTQSFKVQMQYAQDDGDGDNLMKCPCCNALFGRRQLLATHLKARHPDYNSGVMLNGVKDGPSRQLDTENESLSYSSELPIKCPYCVNKIYRSQKELVAHVRLFHPSLKDNFDEYCKDFPKLKYSDTVKIRGPIHQASNYRENNSSKIQEAIHQTRNYRENGINITNNGASRCPYCPVSTMKKPRTYKNLNDLHTHIRFFHQKHLKQFRLTYKEQLAKCVNLNSSSLKNTLAKRKESAKRVKTKTALQNAKTTLRDKVDRQIMKTFVIQSHNLSGLQNTRVKIQKFTHFTYNSHSAKETSFEQGEDRPYPVPMGTLVLCRFCQEKFYDTKYLDWHIKHEHPDELDEREDNFVKDQAESGSSSASCTSSSNKSNSGQENNVFTGLRKENQSTGGTVPLRYEVATLVSSDSTLLGKRIPLGSRVSDIIQKRRSEPIPLRVKGSTRRGVRKSKIAKSETVEETSDTTAMYHCPYCKYFIRAINDDDLLEHVRTAHAAIKGSQPCKYCSHVSRKPVELLQHIRVHDEEKPFSCDICNKRFRQYYQKQNHELSRKDSVCPNCDRKYCTQSQLVEHFAICEM